MYQILNWKPAVDSPAWRLPCSLLTCPWPVSLILPSRSRGLFCRRAMTKENGQGGAREVLSRIWDPVVGTLPSMMICIGMEVLYLVGCRSKNANASLVFLGRLGVSFFGVIVNNLEFDFIRNCSHRELPTFSLTLDQG